MAAAAEGYRSAREVMRGANCEGQLRKRVLRTVAQTKSYSLGEKVITPLTVQLFVNWAR